MLSEQEDQVPSRLLLQHLGVYYVRSILVGRYVQHGEKSEVLVDMDLFQYVMGMC